MAVMYPKPAAAGTDPYATVEPTPYDPESSDLPEQGPVDSSPPGPPLLTPEEAIANAAAMVAAELEAQPPPEPTEPPMVTAYRATLPPEPSPDPES